MKDYYKILGLSPGSCADEVKKAYRKLAKRYHPDTAKSSDLPEDERQSLAEKFKQVNEANAILSQPAKRNRYDRTLKKAGHPFFQTCSKSEPPAEKKLKETYASSKSQVKTKERRTKERQRSYKKSSSQKSEPSSKARPKERRRQNKQQQGHKSNRSPKSKGRNQPEYSRGKKENRTSYNNGSFTGNPAVFNGSYRQYKMRKRVHGIIIMMVLGLLLLLVLFIFSRKNPENHRIEPTPDDSGEYSQSSGRETEQQIMLEIYQNRYSDNLSESRQSPSPEAGPPGENRFAKENARSPDSEPESSAGQEDPPEDPTLLDQIWDGANIN